MISFTPKIIVGICLTVFGVISAIYGLVIYSNQMQNIQLCNSLPGAFNQAITNACNRIPDYLTLGISFIAVGTLLIIIGIMLLASELRHRSRT